MKNLSIQTNMKFHYTTSGKGEPLLFIHGFGGSGLWWEQQKKYFESGFQVVTVDLPGHGQSSWMEGGLLDIAKRVRCLSDALGLYKVNIVASSFGGLVALELYRLMSDNVARISFVGSIPKFARSNEYPAGLDINKIRTLSGQFDRDYAFILDVFFRSLFTKQERDSEQFKKVKDFRLKETLPDQRALKAFLDILEKSDLRDRLAIVGCPVQFITGAEDYICPPEVMEWIQDHMPNARLDFMPGCGHLPFLTKPKEYNELLENFLIN
jgi:pimeloyl-[acyl-carrier protein] methyl ester esterase